MQFSTFNVAHARKDVIATIVDPSARPMPTGSRLLGMLSVALDKTLNGCNGLVGLLEAAVFLFSLPAPVHPGGDSSMSMPGSYRDDWRPQDARDEGALELYSWTCTICPRQGGSANANSGATEVGAKDHKLDTRLSELPPIHAPGSLGVASLLPGAPTTGSASSGGPHGPEVGSLVDGPRGSGCPTTSLDSPTAALALDTIAIAAAPFFSRRARPTSGEFNRQALARFAESSIKMPKLKPLRLRSTIKAAGARPDAATAGTSERQPTSDTTAPSISSRQACSTSKPEEVPISMEAAYSAAGDTPIGLAMETMGMVMIPFFNRPPPSGEWNRQQVASQSAARIKLPKLKALRMKPSVSAFEPGPYASRPSFESWGTFSSVNSSRPSVEHPVGCKVPPVGINWEVGRSREDMVATPCFNPTGRLERCNRVTPRRAAPSPILAGGHVTDLDLYTPSPDSSAPSTPAPRTPANASPLFPEDSPKHDVVLGPSLLSTVDSEIAKDEIILPYSNSKSGNQFSDSALLYSAPDDDDEIASLYEDIYAML